MATKRTASKELNHDNWDDEEEREDPGTFQVAPEHIIKQRVIKTARRRNPIHKSEEDGQKPNIFGNFTGFQKQEMTQKTPVFSFLSNLEPKGSPKATTSEPKTNGSSEKLDSQPSEEYLGKLKGLNEDFLGWIRKHVDENPYVDFSPVFEDYKSHIADIESTNKKEQEKPEPAPTKFDAFQFKAPSSVPSQETQNKSLGFTFGAATSTSNPVFKFGQFSTTPNPFPKMPETKTPSLVLNPVAVTSTSEDNCEQDEDEPPKVEFKPVEEENYVYKIRCKVFVKKDGSFSDRGVGNLFLKSVEATGKTQLIVRADTNLGNLLCNFILSEGLPLQRIGKKDVMVVCIPTPDFKPPPVPILLRVKSPEEADELLKTLEEHKK